MKSVLVIAFSILLPAFAQAQVVPPFSTAEYRDFLDATKNLSTQGLLSLHDAGRFGRTAQVSTAAAQYFDSINARFSLTAYEQQLLRQHGFVVTERLSRPSLGEALIEIFGADLPVFVSTDAILHSVHSSYDMILKSVEISFLIPKLDTLLRTLHGGLDDLETKYAHLPEMRRSLRDADVYLTVALKLLDETAHPVFPAFIEDAAEVDELLGHIAAEQMASYPLFSGTNRYVDFSQFTVRGHYASEYQPELGRYFQAMMWLGRTEMYLIAPAGMKPLQTEADIQRQSIDALLVLELAALGTGSPGLEKLAEIENVVRSFIGESDNVTLPNVVLLAAEAGVESASDLLDLAGFRAFQDTLRSRSYAIQRINSQILMSDGLSPDGIEPAASFLLLGQRFVIDSYAAGSVVFDKIVHEGARVPRMIPKTLDILFALGNDAAGQLIEGELEQYHYAPNLAAVRYLVDSYEPAFWGSTLYNAWLDAIRRLAPPPDRSGLPAFMKTAPWWQEKMNTQLASWSQLRHDNLLYAKQSYTGGIECSFPESYVEPIPEFYRAVKAYADLGASAFGSEGHPRVASESVVRYFKHLASVADTLRAISEKEVAGSALDVSEQVFLRAMLRCSGGCGITYDGWYPRLFYPGGDDLMRDKDLTVADVHTAPTDAAGNVVGWVVHGGTGPANLGVWIVDRPGGGTGAFVGPVMSYYEHVTSNFRRLTDEAWEEEYASPPSFRPDFVNAYLAGPGGATLGSGSMLLTGAEDAGGDGYPSSPALLQNYPNPFNPSTIIPYVIPPGSDYVDVSLIVYDLLGRTVATLVSANLPRGHYLAEWTGTNSAGMPAPSGVYVCKLRAGAYSEARKLVLIR